MKSRNITTIIVEGTDGVGKSELIGQLFKIYNYRYMVYHRGELSNLFYAMKFHRPFATTQVGLPFLHILLTCDKNELRKRIIHRAEVNHESKESLDKELEKVDDQDEFIRLAKAMMNDYHMLILDTTGKSIEKVGKDAANLIDNYVANLSNDETVSEWNRMYSESAKDLNINFTCKDNQPYFNNIAFMSESTLQNGVYERFDEKTYPDNLMFALNYSVSDKQVRKIDKKYDFAYIINSKIKRRKEIYKYYNEFKKSKYTCLVSQSDLIPEDEYKIRCPREFGDMFILQLAKAKATVYCARDLAYLKLQTARLYEAILARQIVFVDKESDLDNDILSQIHKGAWYEQLLYVTPQTICSNYDIIINDAKLYEEILDTQTKWYNKLKKIKGGKF